jgi:transcriptional regulator with XRE-family HTH domain
MYRLKECRQRANMTQQYVALTLGIKPPSVSNWESGKTQPTMDNLIELSKLYNVTTDYLLGLSGNPTNTESNTQESMDEILLKGFRALPEDGKKEILEYLKFKSSKK